MYIDTALPFGLQSAPNFFSAVADALAWALLCNGVRRQLHYLDDFLFVGRPEEVDCVVASGSGHLSGAGDASGHGEGGGPGH